MQILREINPTNFRFLATPYSTHASEWRNIRVIMTSALVFAVLNAQQGGFAAQYDALEFNVPMRDGTKLYTVAWVPKQLTAKSPILMERTPYGAGSPTTGPRRRAPLMTMANYIYVYQDVRGKGKSEGDFVNVRPLKKSGEVFDETTDTYDTCEFLVKNVPKNNGNIGLWGISYPGFYAGIGAINAHPALKAVEPGAPVSDWFLGDDCHHNGVLFLQETFDFCAGFDVPRGGQRPVIDRQGKSAYQFFLDTGAVSNFETKHLKGLIPYWTTEIIPNTTYNQYWKDRSLPRNFKNVKCAVMTVGGFFDKEDLWGALNLYQAGEKQNRTENFITMGPWLHGGFSRGTGDSLGQVKFNTNTAEFFHEKIQFPFFEKYLNGKDVAAPAEANIFETGTNRWHSFAKWPPSNLKERSAYLGSQKSVRWTPEAVAAAESYISDPSNPTPYVADYAKSTRAPSDWLIHDQRFAQARSDVLTYQSEPLNEDVQIVGKVTADFWIKTDATDCDLVVKVIDAYPSDSTEMTAGADSKPMSNFQMMVRSDIFRAKFRNSFEKPTPIKPGEPTRIKFDLNETMHTFRKGHRIMFQVQSSWFPIADRNPNQFMDIHKATDADFKKARISILTGAKFASKVTFRQLPK